MESSSKMESGPPEIMEAVVAALLPPANREPVLGDLQERFVSRGQYLGDAARAVPCVIVSRIIRTTHAQAAVLEVLLVYLAFALCALLQGDASGVLRAWLPALVTGVALRLRDAYATGSGQPGFRVLLEVGLCVLCGSLAFLSEPASVLIPASNLSILMVSKLRTMNRPKQEGNQTAAPASGGACDGDLRRKAEKFEHQVRRRNRREYISCAVVMAVFSGYAYRLDGLLVRAGSAMAVLGSAYIVYHLYRHGSAASPPDSLDRPHLVSFYRAQLVRQRDLQLRVWLWYLSPLVPALVVFEMGVLAGRPAAELWKALPYALFVAAGAFWITRSARRVTVCLQRQIDDLDDSEGTL